jgi:hypothetical protein
MTIKIAVILDVTPYSLVPVISQKTVIITQRIVGVALSSLVCYKSHGEDV